MYGCDAYVPPMPSSSPILPTPSSGPSQIVLTVSSRADHTVDVEANVLNSNGYGVASIPVTFTIGAGDITPASSVTDSSGLAQAVASTNSATVVTAKLANGITASVTVLPTT